MAWDEARHPRARGKFAHVAGTASKADVRDARDALRDRRIGFVTLRQRTEPTARKRVTMTRWRPALGNNNEMVLAKQRYRPGKTAWVPDPRGGMVERGVRQPEWVTVGVRTPKPPAAGRKKL